MRLYENIVARSVNVDKLVEVGAAQKRGLLFGERGHCCSQSGPKGQLGMVMVTATSTLGGFWQERDGERVV